MTSTNDIRVFEVGGSIRDEILGFHNKDKDFTVVLPERLRGRPAGDGFEIMQKFLEAQGFQIFLSTPQYLTVRAHFPRNDPNFGKVTADFVLARSEGSYTDGRRPDEVFVGALEDDLARRDFTVNAMAREVGSTRIIDLHDGLSDLDAHRLRTVGNASVRLTEDALRGLRALRFSVTKGFRMDTAITDVLDTSERYVELLSQTSVERIDDELQRMLVHDSIRAMRVLSERSDTFQRAVFRDGLHLESSLRHRRG